MIVAESFMCLKSISFLHKNNFFKLKQFLENVSSFVKISGETYVQVPEGSVQLFIAICTFFRKKQSEKLDA